MKHLLFILVLILTSTIGFAQVFSKPQQLQQLQQQRPQVDPSKLTVGWHSDTTSVQVDYKNKTYDDKAHFILTYFMLPKKKPINSSLVVVDSTFKAIKVEKIADIKTN